MSKIIIFGALFFSLLIFAPLSYAQENFRTDEVATLEKDEVINKDYFSTGEKVILSGIVNGDAYLAGGNIMVDGVVNGDLLIAGGNINLIGKVSGDVRSAGGNIQIDGEVDGNITALGGNIRVDNDARVLGNLVAGAGNVEIFGPIGKDVTVGAGSLTIANQVGSDIVAGVGQMDLTSQSSVGGDVTYLSQEQANIAKGASISGEITHNQPPREPRKELAASAKNGWSIFRFISSLVFGLLLVLLFPNFTQNTAKLVSQKPWRSLGVGILAMVTIPIFIILLMMTIIGIPLALAFVVLYIFLLFLGHIFTALVVGQRLLKALNQETKMVWGLILGLLILTLVSRLPLIGGLITLVATLLGSGAFLLSKKYLFSTLRSKKLL